jgi:hypothetical protein
MKSLFPRFHLVNKDKDLMEIIYPMLISRECQLLSEFTFCRTILPSDINSIYELRTYLLKPGRMLEWEESWKIGLEARSNKPISAWYSHLGSLCYVHHIWEYR